MSKPFYTPFLHEQNQRLNVGCFPARQLCQGYEPGRATVRVKLAPYPRLAVRGHGFIDQVLPPDQKIYPLNLGEATNWVHGRHRVSTKSRKGEGGWCSWNVRGYLELPTFESTRIGHIVFNLYNFSHSPGNRTELVGYPMGHGHADRSEWRFGPWKLEMDSFWQGGDRFKESVDRDEFFLTHVCFLELERQKLFGTKQAFEVCAFLELAFGFMEGANVGPSLGAGRRRDDPFVWLWPGSKLVSARQRRTNWALADQITGCMSLLEPMWEAWKTRRRREWIERAIPVYLEAARVDLPWDLTIAMAQTGVEMMSALILVEFDSVMSLREYDALHTAAKIRALLDHLGIESTVPDWAECRPRSSKGTLADAVVDIRNAIIHPTTANRSWLAQQPQRAYQHAWHILLEFLELSILYSIGYQGQFNSCMHNGAPDRLPWL